MQTDREAENERWGEGLWIKPQTAACAEKPLKPKEAARLPGGNTFFPQPGLRSPALWKVAGHLTSAVGKSGTANCSSPVTWMCMVVSERWKMVSAWARRDRGPA